MARILCGRNDDDSITATEAVLVRALAALPDAWTLLCKRSIDAAPEGHIDVVLIHPDIGIALVDAAPRDPAASASDLTALLERERFSHFFPGELPLAALSVASEHLADIGERLAQAFEAVPRLSIGNADWAEAVVELVLAQSDLATDGGAEAIEPVASASRDEAMGGALIAAGRADRMPEKRAGPRLALVRNSDRGSTPLRVGSNLHTLPPRPARWRPAWIVVSASAIFLLSQALVTPDQSPLDAGATPSLAPQAEIDAAVVPEPVPASSGAPAPAAATNEAKSPPTPTRALQAAGYVVPRSGTVGSVASNAPRHSQIAIARHVRCADWLHQNRPGGSDYHGPPVKGCRRSR
jgi:hypothetical protein